MSQHRGSVLIVEDEFTIALDLEYQLQELGFEVLGIAQTYREALALAENLKPQVILMDVQLKGQGSGIEAARAIAERWQIPLVFLTAQSDRATFEEAMSTGPFGFLLKPFRGQDVAHALELALYRAELMKEAAQSPPSLDAQASESLQTEDTFFVKDKGRFVAVKVMDILWLEALDNYTLIVLAQQKLVANDSLTNFERRLPGTVFFRIHRSFLVNLRQIKRIEDNAVYVKEDAPLTIGKTYREAFWQRLKVL